MDVKYSSGRGSWVIDIGDGEAPLTVCTCCGQPFATKLSAELIMDSIKDGEITVDMARSLQDD